MNLRHHASPAALEIPLGDGLRIRAYPNLERIHDEGRFAEYVRLQRYVWGHRGVCEYAVCQDLSCRALVSLEEAWSSSSKDPTLRRGEWLPFERFEEDGPLLVRCPVDAAHGLTELYLDPELFAQHVLGYCKAASGVLLLGQDDQILGFGDAWVGPLADAIESINYRGAYDSGAVATSVKRLIRQRGKPSILSLNKLAILPSCRRKGLFRRLMSALIEVTLEANHLVSTREPVPVLGDTRRDSRIWPHLSVNGFTDLCEDRHGWVLTAAADIEPFRVAMSLPEHEFAEIQGPQLAQVVRQTPHHERRFYTEALHLRASDGTAISERRPLGRPNS